MIKWTKTAKIYWIEFQKTKTAKETSREGNDFNFLQSILIYDI